MKKIDKEATKRAKVVAHLNDQLSHDLGVRLSDEDYEALQKASKICYRIAKKGVVEVQL